VTAALRGSPAQSRRPAVTDRDR